ncbi:MAG: hypothetical protein NPINA01_00120 [Nitrospinaceae bacterium]|nr:MAG: hypothetical protein NPINA01_00120 [Nitrospinaceae bacterium]
MDLKEGRAHLNYLLTLNIRREEAFGPLALNFIKEQDLDAIGLSPDEQFSLYMATIQALAPEPKRYHQKLELLLKAKQVFCRSDYFNSELDRHLDQDIQKTQAELEIYGKAMRPSPGKRSSPPELAKQRLIVETDVPEYFLDIAQKRATTYYQEKFGMTRKAKNAQHFSGSPRKFEPGNPAVQKEFEGACAPFMNSRTNAFHLMLPFDLKISRKPDNALDAIIRIFYAKKGYSFPLAYEMGKLISHQDGQVLDISMDDPHLLFVSASEVKEREFKNPMMETSAEVPPGFVYPVAVMERSGTLGPFFQIVTHFKVWFDASVVSLLIEGAPDLYEYGLQGGSGLMTRSHASDKVENYVQSAQGAWREGLSFNYVNIHLQLSPGVDTAFVPFNTPLFTLHPVLNHQSCKIENLQNLR